MRVCAGAPVRESACAQERECAGARVRVCACTCVGGSGCARVRVWAGARVRVYACARERVCACGRERVCACARVRVCACARERASARARVRVYVYIRSKDKVSAVRHSCSILLLQTLSTPYMCVCVHFKGTDPSRHRKSRLRTIPRTLPRWTVFLGASLEPDPAILRIRRLVDQVPAVQVPIFSHH